MLNGSLLDVKVVFKANRNSYARLKDNHIIISVSSHLKNDDAARVSKDLYERIKRSIEKNPQQYMRNLNKLIKFKDGQRINTIFGNSFMIKIDYWNHKKGSGSLSGDVINIKIPEVLQENQREKLVYMLAGKLIGGKLQIPVFNYASDLNQKYLNVGLNEVKIHTGKSRWGYCASDKKMISLRLSLLLMENKYIDYVIIHELAHMKYHNHGKRFWKLVGSIIPEYKLIRKELNKNEESDLFLENLQKFELNAGGVI
jgi:predicted metal-dependent hydrolase